MKASPEGHPVPASFRTTLVLLVLLFCRFARADEVPFENIQLTPSATGHCLVPVTIDGHKARFMVDSGAGTVIVLSTHFAKSIGKELANLDGGTALGGAIQMHKTDVGRFTLGTSVDFGSYSLAVPSRFVAEGKQPEISPSFRSSRSSATRSPRDLSSCGANAGKRL